jgi:hypothetical protein
LRHHNACLRIKLGIEDPMICSVLLVRVGPFIAGWAREPVRRTSRCADASSCRADAWQGRHVRAEALRQALVTGVPAVLHDRVVDTIVDLALQTCSIRFSVDDSIPGPEAHADRTAGATSQTERTRPDGN